MLAKASRHMALILECLEPASCIHVLSSSRVDPPVISTRQFPGSSVFSHLICSSSFFVADKDSRLFFGVDARRLTQ